MTTVTTEQSVDIQIGERVHQMLFRKRLSQTKVAPKMGISQSVLSRKLRGEIIWTAEDVLAAAQILDVPVTALLPRLDLNQQPSGSPSPQVGAIIPMPRRLSLAA